MGTLKFGTITPDFLIIGAQKSGTTALHSYLIQHPQLIAPSEKELHFFDTPDTGSHDDYRKLFPKRYFSKKQAFESTPRYMYYPGTAKRIFDFNPAMKLVIVLRDPVLRAFSAWNMYRQMMNAPKRIEFFKQLEKRSPQERIHSFFYKGSFPEFEEWVDREMSDSFDTELIEPSVVRRGNYKTQIEHFLNYFPKEQFHFIASEQLESNTLFELNRIAQFIGIQAFDNLALNLSKKHQREYDQSISETLYSRLLNYYQKQNKGIEELVGLELPWMRSKN